MSSSTSSSDAVIGHRRIFARILLTILLGMGVALALVRAFALANDASSESLLGRVLIAQRAIPQIAAEEEDLMMFFGSSMVHAGFSPREFDAFAADAGGNVKSFNFGFGGLNPMFQDYVSRRIAEGFEAEDRRLKLILIEFNPFQTTTVRRNRAVALEDSYLALMASPAELMQFVLDDPERGIRMLGIRFLRDGISAEMITTFFWAEPFQLQRRDADVGIEEEEGVEERLDEVLGVLSEKFDEEYPDYDDSDWYYPWQGGGTIKAERGADTLEVFDEYYELISTDYQMITDRLDRIENSGIEDLQFDPDLVDAFIVMVRNFERIADHVEIVMLPKNTDWIQNSPEAIERQRAVVERIQAETGVRVRDFQEIDAVSNDMFSDTTHLNRYYGAVAFTEFLVEEYGGLLRD